MIEKLYPPFRKWSKNCSVYLYSDPHFADEEMQYLRNCIDDDEQVKRINSVVNNCDTLIILGDIGDTKYVSKLNGYKVLIMGNHDKGKSNYLHKCETIPFNSLEEAERAEKEGIIDTFDWSFHSPFYVGYKDNNLFNEVYEGPLMISEKIILSHEPLANIPWALNIHGHDHSHWQYQNDKFHLNICAEHIAYKPINLKEIINSGRLKDIPSIHRITIDMATAIGKFDKEAEAKKMELELKLRFNH